MDELTGEICKRCGREQRTAWSVSSEAWARVLGVMPDATVLCLECVLELGVVLEPEEFAYLAFEGAPLISITEGIRVREADTATGDFVGRIIKQRDDLDDALATARAHIAALVEEYAPVFWDNEWHCTNSQCPPGPDADGDWHNVECEWDAARRWLAGDVD